MRILHCKILFTTLDYILNIDKLLLRMPQFPFTGDSITDDTTDNSLLSGEYIDVGFSTTVKPASRRKSPEEVSLLSGAQGARYISEIEMDACFCLSYLFPFGCAFYCVIAL